MNVEMQHVATSTIRCAQNTRSALATIKHFPTFTHKWSQERRRYTLDDLSIPTEIFLYGKPLRPSLHYIGVGGTRSPSVETFNLVSDIIRIIASRGVAILSGGVPGVDLAAHLAAIEDDKGTTYCVLANPAATGLQGHEWSNTKIEALILRNGGFISEYSAHAPVFSSSFLERLLHRDRIISGLSDLFILFECRENSASIDTAKRAILQGKKVVAVRSQKRTFRVGIEQLVDENGIVEFSASKMGSAEIAAAIIQLLSLRL